MTLETTAAVGHPAVLGAPPPDAAVDPPAAVDANVDFGLELEHEDAASAPSPRMTTTKIHVRMRVTDHVGQSEHRPP